MIFNDFNLSFFSSVSVQRYIFPALYFGFYQSDCVALCSSQRKLLAIYLHNDDSVLSNVFCSQMMCADSIVSYLSQNFIMWAWDVTKEANKARYSLNVFRGVAVVRCSSLIPKSTFILHTMQILRSLGFSFTSSCHVLVCTGL